MAIDVSSPSSHPGQNALKRLSGLARQAAPPLFTALAYVLAAKAGSWLAFPSAPVSAFWAPNAILLAALLLTRRERWWVYLLAVLPFHVLVQLPVVPIAQVAIQYVANATEAVLGAWAMLEFCPYPRRFDRLRTVMVLVVFAGVVAPLATSLFMVSAFALAGIPGGVLAHDRGPHHHEYVCDRRPRAPHRARRDGTADEPEAGSGVAHRRSNGARDRAGVDLHAGLRLPA